MRVMLWGGGSSARIAASMITDLYGASASVTGIYDHSIRSLKFETNIPLYTDHQGLRLLLTQSSHYVVCIGNQHGFARWKTAEYLNRWELKPLEVISGSACIDQTCEVGQGSQVMAGAVVHKFSRVGDHCILNTNSTVDHECSLGNGVHVMGSAAIAGRVVVGNYSTIGTNATILPDLVIAENVFIGAGAVVTKDVPPNTIVAGIPARRVGRFERQVDQTAFQ